MTDISFIERARGEQMFTVYATRADYGNAVAWVEHEIAIRVKDDPHRHVLERLLAAFRKYRIKGNGVACFAGIVDGREYCDIVAAASPVGEYLFRCGTSFVVRSALGSNKRESSPHPDAVTSTDVRADFAFLGQEVIPNNGQ